jgi:hypothetical protein
MQKVRCHKNKKLQLFISIKFQYLFNLRKFFFTFPSQYYSLSNIKIFRLWGWTPNFQLTHDLYQFTQFLSL